MVLTELPSAQDKEAKKGRVMKKGIAMRKKSLEAILL